MSEKVNIKKIAELAGVSVATVSRVINQNGRFSPETEERVKKIIAETHYVPNVVAKGLRTNSTNVVGVVVPDIMNQYFARLVLEIEGALFQKGYATVICNTNESRELEESHVKMLMSQQVSGIIFISGNQYHDLDASIPVIYLDRRPETYLTEQKIPLTTMDQDILLIESDNEMGGYLETKCLIDKGCRRIAILEASQTDYNHRARHKGYVRAMEEAGLQVDTSLVYDVDVVSVACGDHVIQREVENECLFDGLVCTSDTLAVGALLGLREKKIKVPEQVMVAGYDDSPLAAIQIPSLSSVHQYVNDMADQATKMMLNLINGIKIETSHVVIPVRMVERESTRGINYGI